MDSCLTDRLQYFRRINDVRAATLAAGRQAQHANLPRDGSRVGGATEAGAARGTTQGGPLHGLLFRIFPRLTHNNIFTVDIGREFITQVF